VRLGRKAPHHVPHRTDDPSGQDGNYAEYLSEGGARSFYLGFYAPVLRSAIFVSSVLTLSAAPPKLAAGAGGGSALGPNAVQDAGCPVGRKRSLATPPGRRSRRSAWRLPLAPGYALQPGQ
jgi:hypothetical protein